MILGKEVKIMFLGQLKPEEKELFLNLCIYAANANDVFVEEEKVMIQEFCREMKIEEPTVLGLKSIKEIITMINDISDMKSKKIMLLELLGVMMVDNEYDEKERKFIYEITDLLGIKKEVLEEISIKLEEYLSICNELGTLVLA